MVMVKKWFRTGVISFLVGVLLLPVLGGPLTAAQEPTADLSISAVAEPKNVKDRGTVTYTLTVTNLGPETATDVEFWELLGADWLNPVSVTCSQGVPSGDSGCHLDSLASGASATATVVASVDIARVGSRYIDDRAFVRSATTDPVSTNNTALVTIKVIGKIVS